MFISCVWFLFAPSANIHTRTAQAVHKSTFWNQPQSVRPSATNPMQCEKWERYAVRFGLGEGVRGIYWVTKKLSASDCHCCVELVGNKIKGTVFRSWLSEDTLLWKLNGFWNLCLTSWQVTASYHKQAITNTLADWRYSPKRSRVLTTATMKVTVFFGEQTAWMSVKCQHTETTCCLSLFRVKSYCSTPKMEATGYYETLIRDIWGYRSGFARASSLLGCDGAKLGISRRCGRSWCLQLHG